MSHVREVLQCFFYNQLYAKAEKCEIHQSSVAFLGYIISLEGVSMDDNKAKAVVNWPLPTTVRELQRFWGFANFYCRFIRDFSSIAAPLTSMLKGGGTIYDYDLPLFPYCTTPTPVFLLCERLTQTQAWGDAVTKSRHRRTGSSWS